MKNLKIFLVVVVLIGISATLTNQILMKPFINSSSVAVTANSTDINKLSGLATTKTELGYLNGTTSAVQTQLDGKVDIADLTSAVTVFYTKPQTDSIAALKASKAGDTFTGPVYVPTAAAGTNTTQAASAAFVNEALKGYGKLIYSNNTQHSYTGSTAETELFNFQIPGNAIGANGTLQFIFKIQSTSGTTGTKHIRIKNGSSVLGFSFINSASNQIIKSFCTTENRNSTSSQISSNSSLTTLNAAYTLTTIDTTQPWTVSVTAQLSVGTENVSIESLSVIAFYKD